MKGIIVLLSFIISPALCGLLSPLDSLRLSRPVVGKDCILSIWALNKLKMLDLVMVRFLARDNFCCWPSQLKKYSLLKKCSKVTPKYYFLLCSLHRDTLGRQTKIKLKFQSLMENFAYCRALSCVPLSTYTKLGTPYRFECLSKAAQTSWVSIPHIYFF